MANETQEFDQLPEPLPLVRCASIKFTWGSELHNVLCTAGSLREAPWEGTAYTWLHCKGVQPFNVVPDGITQMMTLAIPVQFITSIEDGPKFRYVTPKKTVDVGVFPPNKPQAAEALSLAQIRAAIELLQIPERN